MRLLNRKQRLSLITFAVLYFSLFFICRANSARDPGSYFFQPHEGYRPTYSLTRIQESLRYLSRYNQTTTTPADPYNQPPPTTKEHVDLCVGIVTVKRPLTQNIDTTIASLIDSLSQHQRSQISIHLLFALTTPTDHPDYNHPWVHNTVNRVLTYETQNISYTTSYLRTLEGNKKFTPEKSLIDYALSLRSCYDTTDAPYFLMLEDDVVAQRNWFPTTTQTLHSIEEWVRRGIINPDWLYLRLFYTEKFLGWNAENWKQYLSWSLAATVAVAGLCLCLRRTVRPAQEILSNAFLGLVCFGAVPAVILLYFASGRVTVQRPMRPGVHLMNRDGCCSQALVFPREKTPAILEYMKKMEDATKLKPVDSTLERLANEHGFDRLAISPPQMQHVGAASYKEDEKKWRKGEYPVRGAHGVWSMEFEKAYSEYEAVPYGGHMVDTYWPR
ncbi:Glycosyl transferase, family 54 [Aspergillus oryzae]|uniref:Glycosyl transferase, family 54 n=1 Tax=Aspergillus oryzae TaxID=5062 RepID=A0A1S9DV04_ASPOZ|nr:Glycosyl transferase, family 54 [Aspergillus oryzae]